MFVTLEDETGITNVVLWNQIILKHRREALKSKLLAVYGVWQSESGVKHLIAKWRVDHSHLLGNLVVESRDFHQASIKPQSFETLLRSPGTEYLQKHFHQDLL